MEHAPPKCIFPERKDVSEDADYRKSLITVPACDEHNRKKSGDDELMLYVLALSITSGDVAEIQLKTKIERAVHRNPSLMRWISKCCVPISIHARTAGTMEEGLAIQIDMSRFDRAVKHTARALYFHDTGRKFLGPIQVRTPFAPFARDVKQNDEILRAAFNAEQFFFTHPARGENPEVFSYKRCESERSCIMLLTFYEDTKVLVRLDKHSVASEKMGGVN